MNPVVSEERPSTDGVRSATRRLLLAFTALTALAVVQLLFRADVADRDWAWPIRTELTAAFLGAAYAAGLVLSLAALRQHRWSAIRIPVLTVTAFTWLTAVATVIHLHRLHLVTGGPVARAVAWVWLAVYVVIPVVCVVVVAGQELGRAARDTVLRPLPRWLAGVIGAEGAVLFTGGVVLFASGLTVHHHEPRTAAAFWPWALMPLSAQVIGAWLIALGVAAALILRGRDLSRLLVAGMTYTAFGLFQLVAVAWYWPHINRQDLWLWAYLALLVAIVATGAYGWRAAREQPPEFGDEGHPTAAGEPPTALREGPHLGG